MRNNHIFWLMSVMIIASASADTTINVVNRYAYGANIGWLDARGDGTNGATLGRSSCTGYIWGPDVGWIGLGNGPTNGWQYSNGSSSDWGVNHDGTGNLTGYAYGANIGWLTFEQTYGQPRIDLFTGALYGYVWGANVGWLSLSNVFTYVQTDVLDEGPDNDRDGIPDAWEYRRSGGLGGLGAGPADADADGMPDIDEYGADTDPLDETSVMAITSFARSANTNSVTWAVVPTRHYFLMERSSLNAGDAWTDSGLGVLAPGGAPTLVREVVSSNAASYYRTRAVIPLSR